MKYERFHLKKNSSLGVSALSSAGGFASADEGGFATVEFLFAIIIAFGLTMITFSLSITLSVVEVTQYIVYSAARAHAAANFDIDAQRKSAQTKYSSLVQSTAMAPLFQNGWFQISAANQLDIRSGGGRNFEQEYGGSNPRKNLQGVRANLRANVLEMKLPLLGDIKPEDDSFSTNINAILIRETTQVECLDYMDQRKETLWTFDGANRFSRFKKNADLPTPWEDNGC